MQHLMDEDQQELGQGSEWRITASHISKESAHSRSRQIGSRRTDSKVSPPARLNPAARRQVTTS